MRSRHTFYAPLFLVGSKLAAPLKVSFMVGSFAAFFSVANCIVPLGGAFCGIAGSTLIFGASLLFRIILAGGLFPIAYLAQIIPGMFAGYYWACRSAWIRVFIPAACMALFILHPVGGAAWIYSLYWLIPIVLYLRHSNHVFATALGSTFTAHAVGSVIWLYTIPMDAAAWNMLIPIVIFERLLFASGMAVLHRIISWAMHQAGAVHKKRVVSTA